jgi:hypothetical protein
MDSNISVTRLLKSASMLTILLILLSQGLLFAEENSQPKAKQVSSGQSVDVVPLHGSVAVVQLSGSQVSIATDWNRSFEGDMWIGFVQKGALYATVVMKVPISAHHEFKLVLPDNLPSGYIDIYCVPINQRTARRSVGRMIVPVEQASHSAKPASWGVYRDAAMYSHPWHVTSTNMMIWDGKPYIPFGGMINTKCSWEARSGKHNPYVDSWVENLGKRYADLTKYGIDDVFFNGFFPFANPNALNKVLAVSEEHGMLYGISVAHKPEYMSKGFTQDKSYKVFVPAGADTVTIEVDIDINKSVPPHRCLWYLVEDEGVSSEYGVGVLLPERAQVPGDANTPITKMKLNLVLNLDSKSDVERTIVFMPELPINDRDPVGYFAGIDDYIKQIKDIYGSLEYGPGFRMWIDPLGNEMNVRPLAVCTEPGYSQRYSEWLLNKYSKIETLNKQWQSIDRSAMLDFITASRLVPLTEMDQGSVWIDPETSKLYRFAASSSNVLRDLKDYRGSVGENMVSRLADVLKSIADVPVILKHNAWLSDWFVNPRLAGGQDGVGFEPYCYGDSLAYHNTHVPFAEAIASARHQVAWITESSAAAFEGQKDYAGYLDRLQMLYDIDQMMMFGAKGFYHFGFDFAANPQFNTTELVRDPRQLEWLATHSKLYERAVSNLANYKPEVYGWYPGNLRERQIIGQMPRAYEMDGHYTGVSTQIRMAPDGRWIVPALRANADWYGLIVAGDLLTNGQFETASSLSSDTDVMFLQGQRNFAGLPNFFRTAPLDGFTSQGIGIIKSDTKAMTLDGFREKVLGYSVFQTETVNGQTIPDGKLRVWTCVERQEAKLYLPVDANATDMAGKPMKIDTTPEGRNYITLVRPPYEKQTENLPEYLSQGYFYPDLGQPEVALIEHVTVEELLKLNRPVNYRWLPQDVLPKAIVSWNEAENFDSTTFTQPRIEGYSRYSGNCSIGINTHFGPPKGQKFVTTYTTNTLALSKAVFWLRKMDKPSMDVEVRIDGKVKGIIKTQAELSDIMHLNPWNAGTGANNISVGWAKILVGKLKRGDHLVELIAIDKVNDSVNIDTKLMGGDAEKNIGAMLEGRAMRCLQLDAWMITSEFVK